MNSSTSNKIDISIIIPAYNEEKRLPVFLDRVIQFCSKNSKAYEIVVVDDGSRDKTLAIAEAHKTLYSPMQVIAMGKNEGKGYAVKRGFFESRGDYCLFLDADGSVEPEEIEKNIHFVDTDGYDIFVGSRFLHSDTQVLETKWHRRISGNIFNFLIRFS